MSCTSHTAAPIEIITFGYGDRTFIQHRGTDFGEHAMVYFVTETREDVVTFVNGGNGTYVGLDVLELLEEGHPLSEHFRALMGDFRVRQAADK